MGGRHAVVVGSQCAGLPGQGLSFLPERAERLFAVLTDPARGGCDPGASVLVVDPDLAGMSAAVKRGVVDAAAVGATLVLAFVGHAETLSDGLGDADLYLMPADGVVPPDSDSGYLLGQRLREVLAKHAVGLDGLLLVVDACHAGVGALNVLQRAAGVVASSGVRLEMVAATFSRAARDGCFSGTLTRLLSEGLADVSNDYLDAATLLDRVAAVCVAQEAPLRFAMARGRQIAGDPGLWLARNPESRGRWALAGTTTGGHAVELTRSYQLTDALERVQAGMGMGPVTVVVGGAGSGKSALVAALSRPEVAPDLIPGGGFLNAVAFTSLASSAAEVADVLAGQLRSTPGFAEAAERYRARFDAEELDRLPALRRLVVGPLQVMAWPPGRRVRVAVDGLDQLEPAARQDVLRAVTESTDPKEVTGLEGGAARGATGVRWLLTTRPGVAEIESLQGASVVPVGAPSEAEAAEFATAMGASVGLVPAVLAHVGSWLDLRLLVEAVGVPDAGADGDEAADLDLDSLYEAKLRDFLSLVGPEAGPVLAVLAAAGAGPVLPISVAAPACSRLGGPVEVSALRDMLAALVPLVVRADPGTDGEHVGLFHDTLVQHLHRHPPADGDLHAAHWAILAALETVDDAGARAYGRARRAEHLWAVGEHHEALEAVNAGLGPRAADNLNTLKPWSLLASQVLGPEDPTTLATRNSVAAWTGEAGDVVGALQLFRELLVDVVRVLGPDHRDTLTTRSNVAFWTAEAGDPAGALALSRELLGDRERVLGPEHPHTLTTRNNVAGWTGEAGDPAGALELFRELLADRERVLGPDHPDTLATRSNVAAWTRNARA